jgi:hypothetical protein
MYLAGVPVRRVEDITESACGVRARAGLPGLNSHGVAKAAATRAAENGARASQLMAWFGWLEIKQVELCSANAHLLGTNRVEKSLTLAPPIPRVRENGAQT